ncbi:hypothetical protein DFP93_13325 [Aneurinibacillus soli]|uniref:Putative cadmium-transporting ATPase n=1 Tax=Aneurinibacillus soli TaxID=1500254 RepID=A0A0U4WAM8_9BACL|nr:hypothetical protein [Aneurinibacillus soli]PYE57165.1 hypothetical protein DFP93_13325 [Aneurinibacillus soli]BAU25979.1 putative cadmium-transporting ATPase [Aneurinibacillus soli]
MKKASGYIRKPIYIEEIVSEELPQERIRALEGSGKTVMLLSDSARVLGLLAVIRQNIVLVVGLKLLAIFLVIPGWLTLWTAILSDMGATVLVTLNGIRLLSRK